MNTKIWLNVYLIAIVSSLILGCGEPIKTPQQLEQEKIQKELEAKRKAEEEAKRLEQEKIQKELEAKRKAEEEAKRLKQEKAQKELEVKRNKKVKLFLNKKSKRFTSKNLLSSFNFKPKGEFEKTSDFEKRRKTFFKKYIKKQGIVAIEQPLKYKYNADNEELLISLKDLIEYDLIKPNISEYTAKNGFGRRFTVTLLQEIELHLVNQLLKAKDSILIEINPKKASILKNNGKAKILFSYTEKDDRIFDLEEYDFGGDSTDSLYRFKGTNIKANINLDAILIFNKKTKEVLYSYLPEFDE